MNVVKKTNLHVEAKEKNVKKLTKKKNKIKKNKNTKNKDRDEESQDDDWICKDCGDHWDDDGKDRWVICEIPSSVLWNPVQNFSILDPRFRQRLL